MNNKKISKILGWGLSTGLVFASLAALFATPAAAGEMEWTLENTPSWEDHVILPGSDIFDWDVAVTDGDTVYATGHIGGGRSEGPESPVDYCEVLGDYTGLTGSFDFDDGDVSLNPLTTDDTDGVAEIQATFHGNTCFLRGWFTARINLSIPGEASGTAYVSGEITDATGGGDDTLTFSGKLYGDVDATDPVSASVGSGAICLEGFAIQPVIIGPVEVLGGICTMPRIWKSDDGGVTWDDITATVQDATNLPSPFARMGFGGVSIAPDDEEWVAIAGEMWDPETDSLVPAVVASKDGGSNFSYAGDVVDNGESTRMHRIYDIDVSCEVNDIHNIAVAGVASPDPLVGFPGSLFGSIFRLKAGTWLTGSWADTSAYDGWDDGVDAAHLGSRAVMACEFSPNFDLDDSIVCTTVARSLVWFGPAYGIPYLQAGIWESDGDWNDEGGFPGAIQITNDGDELYTGAYLRSSGLALPDDYDGSDPGARSVFVFVNAYNTVTELVGGFLFRVDNSSIGLNVSPSGDPLLASIDVSGDADTGKVVIGEYVRWDNDAPDWGEPIEASCCEGARVWHTEELDFCCPQWEDACKNPSGPYMALVGYANEGEKIYATTSSTTDEAAEPIGLADESAFSVSLDDGVSFNQIGLIDTDIDFLADVAVCPDCSVIYLTTVQVLDSVCEETSCEFDLFEACECDSVWRSYDNGDTWERVFHGCWEEPEFYGLPILRLPCDTDEECCTIYLGLQGKDQIFYSRDCGQCWNETPDTKIDIQDFAVESENIVYVINDEGEFSMSTQYGRRWSDAADTGLDTGHSITSCCNEGEGWIFVGGYDGDPVAWSDDGGESWNTTDDLPMDGEVHVACDPECENIIYAAVDYGCEGAIYRADITDGSWSNLSALDIPYSGIVSARTGGTLYAASYAIGVDPTKDLCEDGRFTTSGPEYYSGVARNLDPCETACCGTEDWDYLICGMANEEESFRAQPSSLRICGCLRMDTNSVLWAIDTDWYDVRDGAGDNDSYGGLWSYEDCAAKHGPELTSPANNAVIDCDPCASCEGAPFTLKWERICKACSYDIQIMDEDGNVIVEWVDEEITGNPPSFYVDEVGIQCGNTYTWHVRMANTDCECVHSPWSETWSFTIAVGAYDAIQLLAPDKGATGVSISNVGFSWTSVVQADSYQFVLSPNANLTGALASQSQGDTAFNYMGDLDYGKVYYWQVKAFKGDVLLTTSSTGVFTTMEEPVPPQDPVVVNEYPPSEITIPPAETITPTWIYAVIGIGAALIVVVIVLIVRTRRP